MRTQQTSQSSGDSVPASTEHVSVLLQEAVSSLNLHEGATVFDGTFGSGGHSREIAKQIGQGVLIVGDLDPKALENAKNILKSFAGKLIVHKGNFADVDKTLVEHSVEKLDAVLLDLGWRVEQLSYNRGFSFQNNEPLNMRYDGKTRLEALTAYDVVNTWSEETLSEIIYNFSGERFAKRIAKAIVQEREKRPIETTFDLLEVIKKAVPVGGRAYRKIHPATKTFQAIRIAVNDEFGSIERGIPRLVGLLKKGGRIAIITFHSTEDRIVKNIFKTLQKQEEIEILTKKPITASEEEIKTNPRSRSAKLRVAIKK